MGSSLPGFKNKGIACTWSFGHGKGRAVASFEPYDTKKKVNFRWLLDTKSINLVRSLIFTSSGSYDLFEFSS